MGKWPRPPQGGRPSGRPCPKMLGLWSQIPAPPGLLECIKRQWALVHKASWHGVKAGDEAM